MARLQKLEATITELAPGGEGVAVEMIDGERRAIFVPGVARGEKVRLEAELDHRPARGRVLALLEPSKARVEPPCAWNAVCGGCDWMHLAQSEQEREHVAVVKRLLPLSYQNVDLRAHRAPKATAYRTRARVHIDALRAEAVVGMFAKKSHAPSPVDTCLVLDPILDAARARLGALLEGARGRGEAQLSLGSPLVTPRRAVVELRWSRDLPGTLYAKLEQAVADGWLAGARVWTGEVKVPATIGDPTPWIVSADGAPLQLARGGFSQATEDGNALLVRRVAELADQHASGLEALELYAGAGNLGVLLAKTRKLTAVESDKDACDAMRRNLATRKLDAKVVCTDATTHPIPRSTKLVVLDPPRTGARPVAQTLAARSGDTVVIYVSCDPPTLGRDLALLEAGGYALVALETFELFPQTSHVETVAVLTRSRSAKA